MQAVAIVIPVYKNEISSFEQISLQQCFKILGKYPIQFICPKKMELGSFHCEYRSKAEFVFFSDDNFESIISYNKMMLSVWFYQKFINYKFILIYQLDCFVFKDELMFWIEQDYSYIGAPWFFEFFCGEEMNESLGVGNGGFSLRNIKDSIKVLKSNIKVKSFNECILNKKTKVSLYWLRGSWEYFKGYSFKNIHKSELVNEDKMFSVAGNKLTFFNIPDGKIASGFAFEKQPKKLFKMNNNKMPFGCHAWWSYDLEFYRPIIRKLGYSLE